MDTVISDLMAAFHCPSQKALAELLGTHATTPYTWKPPDGRIPLKRIVRIEVLANELGVTLPASFYEHKKQVLASVGAVSALPESSDV